MSYVGLQCADCGVTVYRPLDARPDVEVRLCPQCFNARWEAAGHPSDPRTGQIQMIDDGKRVRWSNVVEGL